MPLSIECSVCGEGEALVGVQRFDGIELSCESCGNTWMRPTAKTCATCGSDDLQTVPLAIVERSRGTQLSVVGTRPVDLCSVCDAAQLERYHTNRPNPLMPDSLPTVGEEQMNG
ncbi:hypothetical protein MNBD_ACTINO01-210 [hydrothermal vent metagenome]|uniref:Uncharacterized protein n=1 Tax=hydrothermal vent metagenome TaxID=652676 RepID=A0A3B0RSS3_9ZZZZ